MQAIQASPEIQNPGQNADGKQRGRLSVHGEWWKKPRVVDTALHQGLVRSIAAQFKDRACFDFDDRVSLGNLGLEKAARVFDASRGLQFSTLATWWIRQSILRGYQMLGLSKNSSQSRGRGQRIVSLDSPSRFQSDGEDEKSLQHVLGEVDEALEWVVQDDYAAMLWRMVDDELDLRAAAIIRLRADGIPLELVAKPFGITRERIRQIESKSLKKLRDALVRRYPELHAEIDWNLAPSFGYEKKLARISEIETAATA